MLTIIFQDNEYFVQDNDDFVQDNNDFVQFNDYFVQFNDYFVQYNDYFVQYNGYFVQYNGYFVQVNELKSELEARGQSSKGLKSQLQARLQKLVKVKNTGWKEGFCFYLIVLSSYASSDKKSNFMKNSNRNCWRALKIIQKKFWEGTLLLPLRAPKRSIVQPKSKLGRG